MKILVYRRRGLPVLGVISKAGVVNVEKLLRSYFSSRSFSRVLAEEMSDPRKFFRMGDKALDVVQEALHSNLTEDFLDHVDLEKEILEPPVPSPSKIVGIGLNYMDHVREIGAKVPKEPVIFLKAPSSLIGHNDKILIPKDLNKVDYEIELVVVIKKKVKNASKREALESILGFTIGNDISARDIQIDKRRPWSWAKSYDTFSPLGPLIVTCDELDCEEPDLNMELKLNDAIMQRSRTSEMIFKPYELIMFVSRIMTLYPGDLIFTGTPSGVGFRREPPIYLKDGDVLELSIERIGKLRNFVKG